MQLREDHHNSKEKTINPSEFWSSRYGYPLRQEELAQISSNVVGLFSLLDEWDRHQQGKCKDSCQFCYKALDKC
jgi:hypothetical protein